ncbi:MAG: NADH-quinone oxidoreductase subunit NuoK [Deltaproteobacteria bacterium]|jgi:NADH-quinone oxidoreductase subunit K|nr:NADH-quinone oxidoreductase subunit NuoK [Deltaproteobacteria bacterium]
MITFYLIIAALLFGIGVLGILVRRNVLVMLMCLELMLNAVNLTLVAFSRLHANLEGQIFVLFVMCVAAAEVVVGLAIIVNLFRNFYTVDVDIANGLKN